MSDKFDACLAVSCPMFSEGRCTVGNELGTCCISRGAKRPTADEIDEELHDFSHN